MTLTDDDYRSLAAQCAIEESGRIDRNGETFYVSMDVYVDYDPLERRLTGGLIPVCAECSVNDYSFDTLEDADIDFDAAKLEEMTYDILMQK